MTWLAFVAGAVLSWGVYGAMLHQGQVRLGSPMRALLCVGVAYFLVGVVVPVITLFAQGQGLRGFTTAGTTAATVAGTLGALGAVCIIFSFRTGGTPDLRDAPGLRRRAARQRPLHDGHAPAKNRAQPDALPRLPGHRASARDGAVFQACGLKYSTTCYVQRCCGATCSHVRRARATCGNRAARTARGTSHAAGGTARRTAHGARGTCSHVAP